MEMNFINGHIVGFRFCLGQDLKDLQGQLFRSVCHASLVNDLSDLPHAAVLMMMVVGMFMDMTVFMMAALFMDMVVMMTVTLSMDMAVMMAVALSMSMVVMMAAALSMSMVVMMAAALSMGMVVMMTVALLMDMAVDMLTARLMFLVTVMHMPILVAMQILHIMVMVLMLFIQDHPEITGINPRLYHPLDLNPKSRNRETLQCLQKHFFIGSQIQQRRNGHVPADPRIALQI